MWDGTRMGQNWGLSGIWHHGRVPAPHPKCIQGWVLLSCHLSYPRLPQTQAHAPFENTQPAVPPLAPSCQVMVRGLTQDSLMPRRGQIQVQASHLPLKGLTPSHSGVSNQPQAPKSPLQKAPWLLPPVHSWHPPTSPRRHGNHHRWRGSPDSSCLGIHSSLLPGLPAATLYPSPNCSRTAAEGNVQSMIRPECAPQPPSSITPGRKQTPQHSLAPISPFSLLLGTLAPQNCFRSPHASGSGSLTQLLQALWWQPDPCRN